MKYCEGLDCEFCNEKEPCIYRRANKLQQCLDEIENKIKGLCKRCALDFKVEDVNSIPNKDYCDDAICYSILQLIKQAKEC